MSEDNPIPEAVLINRRRRLPQLVWLIPAIAVLISGWLLINTLAQRGPTVTITFLTAEGIEAGKTRIRHKDVDIGEVQSVKLSDDRSHVVVTAQLAKEAESFIAADTRFWVVRPRVTGGKVLGIGTLLSGAYIGVDVGKSKETSTEFVGLETPPVLTGGMPGSHFVLHAKDVGSLDIGSPVYFRHIQVGSVVAYELDKDGARAIIKIFINAPYDKFVASNSRFWNDSGVNLSMDANGIKLQSQSVVSVLLGGIAFESPDFGPGTTKAKENSHFDLHASYAEALKTPDSAPLVFHLQFNDSLRGLAPGAPVDFRGITVGEVLSVGVEYEQKREWFYFPVTIALYPERIRLHGSALQDATNTADHQETIKQGLRQAINHRGFRAQLRNSSLLTGQLYIALDFFPDAEKKTVSWRKDPMEIPTVRGNLEELQATLNRVLAKLEKIPVDQISGDLRKALKSMDQTAQSIDKLAKRIDGETVPEVSAGLQDLRSTLNTLDKLLASDSPLQQDTRDAMREVGRAAESLRTLADTIERNPDALIWGLKYKKENKP
ncbi:MAG TPA: MlaD family protein [Methylophilaceae bacterium]|nr:MlaD family protein [Methylophilaceae bacterium]